MGKFSIVKKLLLGLVAGMVFVSVSGGSVRYNTPHAAANNFSGAYILLSEYYRLPGQSFTVFGHGFPVHEVVSVSFAGTNQNVTTSGSGDFSTSFTVPFSEINSTAAVVVRGDSSGARSANLSVGNFYPNVSPNTYNVLPGGQVFFSGNGFAPNEPVIITGGDGMNASTTADSGGNIVTSPITLPYQGGKQVFVFTGQLSRVVTRVEIDVRDLHPWIDLAPYYSVAGATLTVQGHGFGASEPVVVMFEGVVKNTYTTNNTGDFTGSFVVPSGSPGFKTISASGASTHTGATQQFTQAVK